MRERIRGHALNKLGFLNGVCTDDGRWVFSDMDPDGVVRVNTAVNAFGLIAGVFEPDEIDRVLARIDGTKGPWGWRLFYPPIGVPPIESIGRLGHGDLAAGVCENGTVYNHGSQGFLARALAAVGDGDRLLEVLRHALPYDQSIHPTEVAKSAPYAMVNYWRESAGRDGEGGTHFLSGTVSTVWRVVLDGLLGFKPGADGVQISPCLPGAWREVRYRHRFRGAWFNVTVRQVDAGPSVRLLWDGVELPEQNVPYREMHEGRTIELVVEVKA